MAFPSQEPFAHLSAPNAAFYREILRAFARAKERFIVHLRPEDVAADLRRALRSSPPGSFSGRCKRACRA
ncbi:DUF2397 family protein [Nonomuraea sp. 3N208]|uniref:DUF2397 family protein n=1 Tax=Nonomuraea sp. 3N208 TaxID=3457421 RepID=UPI003FD43564